MPSFDFWSGARGGVNRAGRNLGSLGAVEDDYYRRGMRDLALGEKARVEAALKGEELEGLRRQPEYLENAAVAMSGADRPQLDAFREMLRTGQMPTRVVEDDALQQSRVEPKYNWTPQQQERMRAAVQSIHQALGSTGKTNAEQMAKAAGELQQTGNLQAAVQAALAGRNPNPLLLKPGHMTNRAVGNTGATLDEITGAQSVVGGSNPLWERHKAESVSRETENRAQAGNASASADRTRAAMVGEAAQNIARFLDNKGNVVEVATVVSQDPKTKAKGYKRMQFNPDTGRFDLPVQPGLKPVQNQGDPAVAAAIAAAVTGGQQTGPKWAGNAPAPAAAPAAPAPSRTATGAIGGEIDQEVSRREANQLAVQKGWKVGKFVPGRGWEMLGPDGKLLGYADGKAE